MTSNILFLSHSLLIRPATWVSFQSIWEMCLCFLLFNVFVWCFSKVPPKDIESVPYPLYFRSKTDKSPKAFEVACWIFHYTCSNHVIYTSILHVTLHSITSLLNSCVHWNNFQNVAFKLILHIDITSISLDIVIIWMPLKSGIKPSPEPMLTEIYGVTRLQLVKTLRLEWNCWHFVDDVFKYILLKFFL